MKLIPENIVDRGYFDVNSFLLTSITGLDKTMEVRFDSRSEREQGFVIRLENVVAFKNTIIDAESLFWIRVDGEGSSFAFDISIRLKEERIKHFHVLYLFKEDYRSPFVFRCLAEKISIENSK